MTKGGNPRPSEEVKKIKNKKKERKKKEEHIQKKLLRHKLSINA